MNWDVLLRTVLVRLPGGSLRIEQCECRGNSAGRGTLCPCDPHPIRNWIGGGGTWNMTHGYFVDADRDKQNNSGPRECQGRSCRRRSRLESGGAVQVRGIGSIILGGDRDSLGRYGRHAIFGEC